VKTIVERFEYTFSFLNCCNIVDAVDIIATFYCLALTVIFDPLSFLRYFPLSTGLRLVQISTLNVCCKPDLSVHNATENIQENIYCIRSNSSSVLHMQ
jgi:hypothetical protein